MTETSLQAAAPPRPRPDPAPSSTNREGSFWGEGSSVWSWLSTVDHKRIGVLYAISITLFFFLGGAAAALMRFHLFTPQGLLFGADTYNRLMTLHGVVMVWFFLVPSIPTTFGNFLLPLMIGARDLAFPKLNLLSWYVFLAGRG